MKKCWAKQVEGHEHDMLGKDQVHKQHDFPELAGFVVLGYFGLVFWLGLIWGFFGCGFFFLLSTFPFFASHQECFCITCSKSRPTPTTQPVKAFDRKFLGFS